MATKGTGLNWQNKVNNYTQIGGIETSVLDNGPGKGTRIAWINTGAGLRYKVVIDRALDIVDAFYNQYSLAWLSHAGVTTVVIVMQCMAKGYSNPHRRSLPVLILD